MGHESESSVMMINKMVTAEHRRRSEEWNPPHPAIFYAMKDYFQNALGYREEEAHDKALKFVRG